MWIKFLSKKIPNIFVELLQLCSENWRTRALCSLLNQSTLSSIAQLETTICPLKVLLICHEKFKSLSKVSKSLFWEWTQQQHCDDDKSHKIWKVHPFTPHLHPGFNEIHFRTSCTHYAPFLTWPVDPIHLLISTSKNSFWSLVSIKNFRSSRPSRILCQPITKLILKLNLVFSWKVSFYGQVGFWAH